MSDRVLTVRQPWADLIMAGIKDVENRTWPVPSTIPCAKCRWPATSVNACVGGAACDRFPFRLGIHAASKWADGIMKHPTAHAYTVHANTGARFPAMDEVERGALLGFVTVTGCHHADWCWDIERGEHPDGHYCSRWAEPDVYHWTLADPEPLDDPIPMRGSLGLWRLPAEVAA